MYDKVSYNLEQLNQIYHEDVRLDKRGRMFLKKTRGFQECRNPDFTPVTAMRNGDRGKKTIQIAFNFPHWLPLREPNMSWVELAAETQRSPQLYELLGEDCPLDVLGIIPGSLGNRKMWSDVPGEFYVEDEPRHAAINYTLFIVNSSNQALFVEAVRDFLAGLSDKDPNDICDPLGNRVLMSTSSTEHMILVPIALLNGGKVAVIKVWETVFKKKRR
ncbi:hypothetical protein IKG12_03000 [Candidatus Saccharibacteria bacterium]|nr:hypothetical protein [Candidatus Saccharibacteria bacterium]